MNNVIYDITRDKKLQRLLVERSKYIDEPIYKTDYGNYGTSEWWERIHSAGIVESKQGTVKGVFVSGHNDYPEFEIEIGEKIFRFARKGDERRYIVGLRLQIWFVKYSAITLDPLDSGLDLIRVEQI